MQMFKSFLISNLTLNHEKIKLFNMGIKRLFYWLIFMQIYGI